MGWSSFPGRRRGRGLCFFNAGCPLFPARVPKHVAATWSAGRSGHTAAHRQARGSCERARWLGRGRSRNPRLRPQGGGKTENPLAKSMVSPGFRHNKRTESPRIVREICGSSVRDIASSRIPEKTETPGRRRGRQSTLNVLNRNCKRPSSPKCLYSGQAQSRERPCRMAISLSGRRRKPTQPDVSRATQSLLRRCVRCGTAPARSDGCPRTESCTAARLQRNRKGE